jgi:hypothetical protein
MFEIIEKCCVGQSHEKISITDSPFLNNMLAIIDQWRTVSKEAI